MSVTGIILDEGSFLVMSVYVCNNSRVVGWIFAKYVIDVMPFEATPESYFLILYSW
jgi:hypothetical protein